MASNSDETFSEKRIRFLARGFFSEKMPKILRATQMAFPEITVSRDPSIQLQKENSVKPAYSRTVTLDIDNNPALELSLICTTRRGEDGYVLRARLKDIWRDSANKRQSLQSYFADGYTLHTDRVNDASELSGLLIDLGRYMQSRLKAMPTPR
jgi:hypothetical protein